MAVTESDLRPVARAFSPVRVRTGRNACATGPPPLPAVRFRGEGNRAASSPLGGRGLGVRGPELSTQDLFEGVAGDDHLWKNCGEFAKSSRPKANGNRSHGRRMFAMSKTVGLTDGIGAFAHWRTDKNVCATGLRQSDQLAGEIAKRSFAEGVPKRSLVTRVKLRTQDSGLSAQDLFEGGCGR